MLGSSHRGISVVYLMQNLFPPGKLLRTISLNSHYLVIFRNRHDSLGISTLAKQMFPGRTDYLMESFCDATKQTLWVSGDRLPLTHARKYAVENEHFAEGETDRIREMYLNCMHKRKRSFSICRNV